MDGWSSTPGVVVGVVLASWLRVCGGSFVGTAAWARYLISINHVWCGLLELLK
jgi:hypothetical protein